MSRIVTREELRNRSSIFKDRAEAGAFLAEMLVPGYQGEKEVLVLAIPSGGVPVGLAVAKRLGLPMDVVIVRKLQVPGNAEAGFGAMALDGQVYLNEEMVGRLGLLPRQIEAERSNVSDELIKRDRTLRHGRSLPDLEGKIVIIADDGLASGFTMIAAAEAVRKRGGSQIIAAVPTAPKSSIERILPHVDAVYAAHIQDRGPFAVANAYRRWRDLTREEVAGMLEEETVGKP